MTDQPTIDSEVDQIFEKYGYFLGLAYEDENGNLAQHKAGKVKQEILNLIAQAANKARIEGEERGLRVLASRAGISANSATGLWLTERLNRLTADKESK